MRLRLKTLAVLLLALVLSAPWGRVMSAQVSAPTTAVASASEACPDCDADCPPGQMVRSGCMGMCASAPAERFAAIAPAGAQAPQHAHPDDLGVDGLRPRPEPTPPRLRA